MTSTQYMMALVVLVVSGLVGGALGSWLMRRKAPWARGVAVPGVVTATRFRLVDAEEKERAVLGITADGTTGLGLLDAAGKLRVALGITADDTLILRMADVAGKQRATLAVGADGSPGLVLYDAAEKLLWSAP